MVDLHRGSQKPLDSRKTKPENDPRGGEEKRERPQRERADDLPANPPHDRTPIGSADRKTPRTGLRVWRRLVAIRQKLSSWQVRGLPG